jgi:undecaprenyl diphosphate synthase
MDGNGRWAQAQGLPRSKGHKAGLDNIQRVLKVCYDKGIQIVSVFAWSTENWSRPPREVNFIMQALEKHLPILVKALHEENIRFNHIGNVERLSSRAQDVLRWANHFTVKNGPSTFNFAFNYGGRDDIIHSLRTILAQKIPSEMITKEMIEKSLYTGGAPDVDLLFRTGGERRVSNFMLWQSASAYICFTDTYWPDIGESEIDEAIIQFHNSALRRTICL